MMPLFTVTVSGNARVTTTYRIRAADANEAQAKAMSGGFSCEYADVDHAEDSEVEVTQDSAPETP